MNLVESILDQVSGNARGKLSSLSGTDGQATRKAVQAAVPTILASLAGLAANKDGAKKLAAALNNPDAAQSGNLTQMLGGDGHALLQQGSGLLDSLLGENAVSSIASAIGRFAGLGPDAIKKLLASLLPAALGLVAGQWKNYGGTPDALSELFANQKRNIVDALPEGYSTANVPGLAEAEAAINSAGDTLRMSRDTAAEVARRGAQAAGQANRSLIQWLGPLAAILLVGLGLLYFVNSRRGEPEAAKARDVADKESKPVARTVLKPELPKVDAVTAANDLKNVFADASEDLSSVRDADSAAAALPKLTALYAQIDSIRDTLDQLPPASQAAVGQLVGKQMGAIQEQVTKVLAVPGAEKLRPVLEQINTKLAGMNAAQVSENAGQIVASLTETLEAIQDPASVQAALPQLEKASEKLDELKKVQASMSRAGRSVLAKAVAAARGKLEELFSKVLDRLGPDAAAIKPVAHDILNKLNSLTE